jgi:hypothetical protein
MDLIHFLRCRYETAYLFSPPKENLVNTETLYDAKNSSVYKIRNKISELIVKDHAPEENKENKENNDYNINVETAKKLYSDIIHEIFIEYAVIQPFLIHEKNINFAALYGYFMCNSQRFIRPGQQLCSHSEDNKTVKLYSLYEYIKGVTVSNLIEKEKNIQIDKVYDILLQVFGNLWSVQNNDIIYNHNDLHLENVMVETLDEPITHDVKGYEWSSNYRVVIIDQGLASCVFKHKDCKALSWYKQDNLSDLPDDLSGFDVFRLTSLMYLDMKNSEMAIFNTYTDILFSFFEKYGFNRKDLIDNIKEQESLGIYPERMDSNSNLFRVTYQSFFLYIYDIYKGGDGNHSYHPSSDHENLPDIPPIFPREESGKESMFKGLQSLFKDSSHSDHSHHSKDSKDHSDHSDRSHHSHHSHHSKDSDHSDHSHHSHHSHHSKESKDHSDHSRHSRHSPSVSDSDHSRYSKESKNSDQSSHSSDHSLNDLNKESINKLISLLKKQENIDKMKREEEKIIIHNDHDDHNDDN